jgi:hypothetical protein
MELNRKMESVWVFNGIQSRFPSGIFSNKATAEGWINKHSLTGTLTEYPIDTGMYDYAILKGQFQPKKPEHGTPLFIGKFSGGGIDHFHYVDGSLG